MELIRSNENVRVYFSSNAIVYKQSIADMLKTGRGKIIISPDAGTPETIAKVRGFDCFDATIGNAKKYAEALPNKLFLSLKYILLEGVNDNENDIRKFLNIVKEIGCTALLSSNLFELAKGGLSERSMELCRLFMRICKENDLVFRFVDYYFADKDRVAIESYKAELDLCR
jgi:adenine C2-methylase RlmN of 23S rRNA A2503 and tRNA A37